MSESADAASRQDYAATPLGEMCRQRDEARDEVERLAAENARLYDGISRVIAAIYAVYEQTQGVMRRPRSWSHE